MSFQNDTASLYTIEIGKQQWILSESMQKHHFEREECLAQS